MSLVINWSNIQHKLCTPEEINELLNKLEKDKRLKEVPFYHVRKLVRAKGTWCRSVNNSGVIIRVCRTYDNYRQYSFNPNNTISEEDCFRPSGLQAYEFIESEFRTIYGGSKSIFSIFSGMKYKEEYNLIKGCVPKPISMINKHAIGKKLDHCWKADVSSAYPFEGTKKLPTLRECKKLEGVVPPTKEFPFAFYIKSHHIAIYKELDTRKWAKVKKWYTLYEKQFNDNVHASEEITILCKACDYSLDPVFSLVYDKKKKGDSLAKFGMNAFIGFCHKNSNPRLSHVAACILARCCDRMLNTSLQIEKEHDSNIVLFIATDSIVWKGKASKCATDEKYLGSFTYEAHNCQFFAQGPKAYQLINDDGELITKYAGMKNGSDKEKLGFGKLPILKGSQKYVIEKDGRITEVYF